VAGGRGLDVGRRFRVDAALGREHGQRDGNADAVLVAELADNLDAGHGDRVDQRLRRGERGHTVAV
jgi:hypothetical protein